MKTHHLLALLAAAALLPRTPAFGATRTPTNAVPGQTATMAPPFVPPQVSQRSGPTNGAARPNEHQHPSILDRRIKLTATGAEADFGRHKVLFKSDIAEARPIRITTPGGQVLACRPAFLVLANRATGQNLLLGEITNRIGTTSSTRPEK